MNETIKYLSCGKLGDFVHQLSVINENYLLTKKKGDLYLVDNYHTWPSWEFGVEKAYDDLKNIIPQQEYISSFRIYNSEIFNDAIDLSWWRDLDEFYWKNNTTHYESVKETFDRKYHVNWGNHPWLTLPVREEFKDVILIWSSISRPNVEFDFNSLKNYNKKIYFGSTNFDEYNHFKNLFKSDINFLLFKNLKDFWSAINSCYLFVSTFGSPLSVAHAFHKNNISLLPNTNEDVFISKNLPNLKWFKNKNENNV